MSETNSNGNGRVPWEDSMYLQAFELARQGHGDEMIADALGVRLHILRRWMRDRPVLDDAITRGRGEADLDERSLELSHLKGTQRRFLAAFAETGNISRAAINAGVTREQHYRWIDDEDYRIAFQTAEAIAVDSLEEEAWRRARTGLQRPKFHNGLPIMQSCNPNDPDGWEIERQGIAMWVKPYIEFEYSDTLLIFLLKAARPAKFRDKAIEVNQHNNTAIGVDMNALLDLAERKNVIEGDFVELEAQQAIDAHNAAS